MNLQTAKHCLSNETIVTWHDNHYQIVEIDDNNNTVGLQQPGEDIPTLGIPVGEVAMVLGMEIKENKMTEEKYLISLRSILEEFAKQKAQQGWNDLSSKCVVTTNVLTSQTKFSQFVVDALSNDDKYTPATVSCTPSGELQVVVGANCAKPAMYLTPDLWVALQYLRQIVDEQKKLIDDLSDDAHELYLQLVSFLEGTGASSKLILSDKDLRLQISRTINDQLFSAQVDLENGEIGNMPHFTEHSSDIKLLADVIAILQNWREEQEKKQEKA